MFYFLAWNKILQINSYLKTASTESIAAGKPKQNTQAKSNRTWKNMLHSEFLKTINIVCSLENVFTSKKHGFLLLAEKLVQHFVLNLKFLFMHLGFDNKVSWKYRRTF